MRRVHNMRLAALYGLMLLVAMALLSREDMEEQKQEQKEYCEMVALHRANPDVGWPDYKGNFSTQCKVKQ